MKAMVLRQKDEPFLLEERPDPKPGPGRGRRHLRRHRGLLQGGPLGGHRDGQTGC
jgi:hypothetical protein